MNYQNVERCFHPKCGCKNSCHGYLGLEWMINHDSYYFDKRVYTKVEDNTINPKPLSPGQVLGTFRV